MSPEFSIFAGIAGAIALWQQIRGFFDRLRALFVTRTTLYGEVARATSSYLYAKGRVVNWGDRLIRSSSAWVRPLDRVTEVAYETAPMQPLIAWLNGRPLMFHCPRHGSGGNMPEQNELLVITAFRGTLNIIALTKAALDHTRALQTTGRRYFVRRCGGDSRPREAAANAAAAGRPERRATRPVP